MKFEVGQIIKCPKTVAESGWIKIFGIDNSEPNRFIMGKRGNYLVREYYPHKRECRSEEPFHCEEWELEKWALEIGQMNQATD